MDFEVTVKREWTGYYYISADSRQEAKKIAEKRLIDNIEFDFESHCNHVIETREDHIP